MSSGWALEARVILIQEVVQILDNNSRFNYAESPKADAYQLIKNILDDKTTPVSTGRMMTQILRKSAVWLKLLPFLTNINTGCKGKDCGCNPDSHEKGTGKCHGKKYHYDYNKTPRSWDTPCLCTHYVPRLLK